MEKVPYQIMRKNNGKVADESVQTKDHKIQIGWGYAPASDFFSSFYRITGDDTTCEVLLDYPNIGGEDIKHFVKKSIRNRLHANIYVHSRRLISEFPGYGVKCISILQSHCANMTFVDKSRYDRLFQQVTHKVGE